MPMVAIHSLNNGYSDRLVIPFGGNWPQKNKRIPITSIEPWFSIVLRTTQHLRDSE